MLTVNQRDILAGLMTQTYLEDGDQVTYKQWIETYEYYRDKISECCEEEKNESSLSD